jgi:non-specific serine/threonine protein kinase
VEKSSNPETQLSLRLSPQGHLTLFRDPDEISLPRDLADSIHAFFSKQDNVGLLRLGLSQCSTPLPPSLLFWKQFSQTFISELCKARASDPAFNYSDLKPPIGDIETLISEAPFTPGLEYLNTSTIPALWQRLIRALQEELIPFQGQIEDYFSTYDLSWNTVGKVCVHLAENKSNAHQPFAFLATYISQLSPTAEPQHLPLNHALAAFSGKNKKNHLLALLVPVQRAAEKSVFFKNLLDTGKIFQALAWSAADAYQFLQEIPLYEAAGIRVRVPNWWNVRKPPRPSITLSIGNEPAQGVGLNALLDFSIQLALPSGETLTPAEFEALLLNQEALVQIKGQWIQIDRDQLKQVLAHWKTVERQVKKEGLSFSEGLRLLAGIPQGHSATNTETLISTWSTLIEGKQLRSLLQDLRRPTSTDRVNHPILSQYLHAKLRPYQTQGVQWLWCLYQLQLGGCLADDMGLGKTIQILALLLMIKYQPATQPQPHLLILPASLLDNWKMEIQKFAPGLTYWIAHSAHNKTQLPALENIDLVITTYAMLNRCPELLTQTWDILILDEAQAIKNPMAQQTRTVKQLNAEGRFALTGTPVENRLLDLWSLFDFVAPGLLGTAKTFVNEGKQKGKPDMPPGHFRASVRRLMSPYILRRLKTDKSIISDLPDKTEISCYCSLSKQQLGLYQQSVQELTAKIQEPMAGIQRQGLVLSYLMRFKQICNHPHQWLGHGQYEPQLSGKFQQLQILCESIRETGEKVLVFTQFHEIIPALTHFLSTLFGQEGLFLHGQTPIKERAKKVQQFQHIDGPPFFVLSLKAGGTGLTLTAASHVIHFDRWWNPAVENQATDRAHRIGQKRTVYSVKLITKGTVEEKVLELQRRKKAIIDATLATGETAFTSMTWTDIQDLLTL